MNYDENRCFAFHYDLTVDELPNDIPPNSLDMILCIFVFSAIHPSKHALVFSKIFNLLKPNGTLLFRDYAEYDLSELRFKKGHCLGHHRYVRGDGTQVYFFAKQEVEALSLNTGFVIEQCAVDRRLLVNRLRKLKMYRMWIQAKLTKPT